MEQPRLLCAALSAAITGLGGAMSWTMSVQQPAQPPAPSNPQPRPSNPQPRPSPPGQDPPPRTPRPNQPQDQPRRETDQPGDEQRDMQRDTQRNNRNRNVRPFAFQTPQDEARFNQSARRLVQLEQRMERSNQDLLRRLGEARTQSADRQNAAVMDVLQQMLKNQADLQQYLVQARTGWTGDIDLDDMTNAENPQAPQNDR